MNKKLTNSAGNATGTRNSTIYRLNFEPAGAKKLKNRKDLPGGGCFYRKMGVNFMENSGHLTEIVVL